MLCAQACEEGGLNVVKLPDKTIDELDKIFPPRWSRQNPVDPAGDRNFVAYMTAPLKLLELDRVDSLIFMGFGGFILFSNLLMQQRSHLEEKTDSGTAGAKGPGHEGAYSHIGRREVARF